MSKDFFPQRPKATPTIYAYELPNDSSRKGQLKIGDTNRTVHERIKEQIGATRAEVKIVLEESAMRKDGSSFRDFEFLYHLLTYSFLNNLETNQSKPKVFFYLLLHKLNHLLK